MWKIVVRKPQEDCPFRDGEDQSYGMCRHPSKAGKVFMCDRFGANMAAKEGAPSDCPLHKDSVTIMLPE